MNTYGTVNTRRQATKRAYSMIVHNHKRKKRKKKKDGKRKKIYERSSFVTFLITFMKDTGPVLIAIFSHSFCSCPVSSSRSISNERTESSRNGERFNVEKKKKKRKDVSYQSTHYSITHCNIGASVFPRTDCSHQQLRTAACDEPRN